MNKFAIKTIVSLILCLTLFMSVNVFSAATSSPGPDNKKEAKIKTKYELGLYLEVIDLCLKELKSGYKSRDLMIILANSYYYNLENANCVKWFLKADKKDKITDPILLLRFNQALISEDKRDLSVLIFDRYLLTQSEGRVLGDSMGMGSRFNSIKRSRLKYDVEYQDIDLFGTKYVSYIRKDIIYITSNDFHADEIKDVMDDKGTALNVYSIKRNKRGAFAKTIYLDGDLNKPNSHQGDAVLFNNGKSMYFTRSNGKLDSDKLNVNNLRISQADRKGKKWKIVGDLDFKAVGNHSYAHPTLNAKGDRLYFSSNMKGTLGQSDIYYINIVDSKPVGKPINMGLR